MSPVDPSLPPPDLPPQRAAVLAFLRRELAAGRAPSLAEIAEAFGFASRNAAQKHVQALLAEGLLEQDPGRKRGLRLPGGSADLLELPVLGRVAAGVPIGADIGLDQQRWLDRRLFSPSPDYLLRVQGDSMIDDGILDGDLVGVQRGADARDGQIVIARVDGELTIKRLQRERRRILLLPRNPAHAPIVVEPGQDFAIEGLYCGLVRCA
ncbi:transcriptional repressor LexA [uncultured Aquimonas sp.]|jgi:repressor LexA|uniref:transcriptional repressor LexA n=1 Tax=uncultured Aquimonas sp. TaxID=385483 RepID=UPI00086C7B62|nr:transcriptional repressor LexA [uncultured Aquimonas sp.]ODU44639.1 MAG: repressor LexA [Xanthomonadaceae bacterium SCN 69-123]